MPKAILPAYRHPTTILLVDDDPNFLANLELSLHPEYHCQGFTHPEPALAAARQAHSEIQQTPLNVRDAVGYRDLAFNDRRFDTHAIAIVDYDMPGMDGLQLCEALDELGIQTILLTGKADENLAVQAFNDRLIDRFVQKSQTHFIELLRQYILELSLRYFQQHSRDLSIGHRLRLPDYLENPEFIRYYKALATELNLIEHYWVTFPNGLLGIDANGQTRFTLIQGPAERQQQLEIAEAEQAPPELIEQLHQDQQLFWFPGGDGYFRSDIRHPEQHGYPAQKLSGTELLIATMHDYPIERDSILNYQHYLHSHGQQAPAETRAAGKSQDATLH